MSTSTKTECVQCKKTVSADEVIRFGDTVVCSSCKETYVQRLREGVDPDPDLDEYRSIRQTHLRREASIKSMGTLFILSGVLAFLRIAYLFFYLDTGSGNIARLLFYVAVPLVTGPVNILVGYWFRKLDAKARILGTVICILGLLRYFVPLGFYFGLYYGLGFGFMGIVGSALNIYFLYLMHSETGRRVMSVEYRTAREATPEIKCGGSFIMTAAIILIGLLTLLPFISLIRQLLF